VNVIGFDDGPFLRAHRGAVLLVGAVCAGTRLDGVVTGHIRRDGADATKRMVDLVKGSPFEGHVRAVMLQGIAVGGFNVVDIHELSEQLELPVLVVMRRQPDTESIRRALFGDEPGASPRVPGAKRKWRLIERAGPIERLDIVGARSRPTGLGNRTQSLRVQRAGLSVEEARRLVRATTLHGQLPEPLRLAHLIAGGLVTGRSRGRA
jgi:endonuclease V-like protein UPF0215 family